MKIFPVGAALSLFLIISFTACMLWGLVTPMKMHMYEAWAPLMPGFHWSITGYLIGLAWVAFYGWFIAALFVPLYNFFNRKNAS